MAEIIGLNVNLQEIKDQNITSKIDLKDVLPEAKRTLEQYYDKHVKVINNNFNGNKWVFRHKLNNEPQTFDFDFAKNIIKFSKIQDVEEFIDILKCWIALKLNERSIESVRISFYDVLSACFASHCFSVDMMEIFFSKLEQHKIYRLKRKKKEFNEVNVSDININVYCRNLIDFLEFYDSHTYSEYLNKILIVKSKTKVEVSNRTLPSYVDILKFKKYIDFWAESMDVIDRKEYLRFFPVYLWWEITTIIPMRPSELCKIQKNCLSYVGNMYYLTFPRLKKHRKGVNRLQDTYDTLPIPQIVYERIESYIKESSKNKESEYLFDFNTFVESTREVKIDYDNEEGFTIIYLFELIGKFYKQVIYEQYKVSINYVKGHYKNILCNDRKSEYGSFSCLGEDSIDGLIRPGDLRHVAILNMFLQGYDPVEIQRLAGHLHEETQLGYQRHMQFWVDSQIHQLAIEFSNYNIKPSHTDYRVTIHPKAVEQYNKLYRRKTFIQNVTLNIPEEQDLEIGFCLDETMPCPTFNWRHTGCYFCNNWEISEVELKEKKEEIIQDMSLIYDELKDKVNFIKSLLLVPLNDVGNFDKDTKNILSVTSKEVQDGIADIAKIVSLLGVK